MGTAPAAPRAPSTCRPRMALVRQAHRALATPTIRPQCPPCAASARCAPGRTLLGAAEKHVKLVHALIDELYIVLRHDPRVARARHQLASASCRTHPHAL